VWLLADRLKTDIGGELAGKILREEREPIFWERQLLANYNILQGHGILVYRRDSQDRREDEEESI